MYKRLCPICKNELVYKTIINLNLANKRNTKCRTCRQNGKNNSFFGKKHSEETKQKLSKQVDRNYTKTKKFSKLVKIGMNGKNGGGNVYHLWTRKYGKNIADKKLEILSNKRSQNSTGSKNSMYGKPSPQGSGNGWKGWYGGFFFRSIRELMFIIKMDGKDIKKTESKKFAIEYVDPLGKTRNYFPDFLVDNKYLYEIKPKKLWNTPLVKCKKSAAELFCVQNGFEYIMQDCDIDYDLVLQYTNSGKIKWMGDYEKRFRCFAT